MKSIALAIISIVLACALPVAAQSPTGSIDGLIVDQSHAALATVTVTLVEEATRVERTVSTDVGGVFRAPLLPVGVYELSATLEGFRSLRETNIALAVGQTIGLRLEMVLTGAAETVTVSAPILETGRSQASSVVNEVDVRNLPVNGRNFIDFALLTPGVTRDTNAGDLSFAGQRGFLNSLVVDGADNNNTVFGQSLGRAGNGRAPYQFSQDTVKEFQVNSNAYAAEYGRAGAGMINVVTKSGTNETSGSAFEFYRDKALNGKNAINVLNGQPRSPYHYNQFGGSLGGPLRVSRDFFFASYEGQRNSSPNTVFLNLPSDLPTDAATTAALARLTPLASSWNRRLDQDVFFVKTNHAVGGGQLTLRYNHQNFTGDGYESGGVLNPQNAFEHTGASLIDTRTLSAIWIAPLGRSRFNEARVQYLRDGERGTANSENPEVTIFQSGAPVLTIGRNSFSPRFTNVDRVQAADSLTWTHGNHEAKTGIDVQRDHISNFFPQYFSGSYSFRSLASFQLGRPDQPNEFFQQNFPGPGTTGADTTENLTEFSAFVQDAWKPRPDTTVNLGLRYDVMVMRPSSPVRNPDPQLAAAGIDTSRLDPDTNNVGPRLGVSWSPVGRRYVVRAGWGVFYGRVPAIHAPNNGVNVVSLTFTGDEVPTYPQIFSAIPATGTKARPNISYFSGDYTNPREMQANAAIEWELTSGTSIAVTYLDVYGTGLPRSTDTNIGSPGLRTFTIAGTNQTLTYPFFGPDRPFSNFGRVIAFESNAESHYHGLTIELTRRFTRALQFRAAYTLSRVVDTAPDTSADDSQFVSNPTNFEVDRTVGNNDEPHHLVASGVFSARGWTLSGLLTAASGKPYSAKIGGVDMNGDGNLRNDLAPGKPRNSYRLPAIVTLDARVSRTLPLPSRVRAEIFCEGFNLFNRNNITSVVPGYYNLSGTVLSPTTTFGKPLTSAGERIMQLSVRVAF
jgi:hypothetical protein